MRAVFACSLGGAGHFNPLRPFIDAAELSGDEVVVAIPPGLEQMVEEAGYRSVVGADPPPGEIARLREGIVTAEPSESAVLGDRELFGRLCTAAMLPTMRGVFEDAPPDLVVREPCEYSSAVVAAGAGVPQALVAISQAEIEWRVLDLVAPVLATHGKGVVDRIRESPFLSRFPESLDPSPFPRTFRYREPEPVRFGTAADWWGDLTAPLVYLSYGTVAGATSIATTAYRTALEAMASLEVRVLLTVGRSTDISDLQPIPPNVRLERWVPQADVLEAADVAVCHGGSGTTLGALAAGVPLVIVPLLADNAANGRRVAAAGAGVVVEAAPAVGHRAQLQPGDAPRLAAAVEQVLRDASYRRAATVIRDEMLGAPTAAEALLLLSAGSGPPWDRHAAGDDTEV